MQRRSKCERKALWPKLLVCVCIHTYLQTHTYVAFHDLSSSLQKTISSIFLIKNVYISMGHILKCYGVVGVTQFVVNVLLPTARRQSLNATFKSGHWKLRLATRALFTTERRREFRPEVTFSQTCLEHRSVQTEGNFMKLS